MILTVLLTLQAIAGNASAATIYVEPGDSIQKAVDNARSGDTIVIKPGTYAGGIKVSTANLTIILTIISLTSSEILQEEPILYGLYFWIFRLVSTWGR